MTVSNAAPLPLRVPERCRSYVPVRHFSAIHAGQHRHCRTGRPSRQPRKAGSGAATQRKPFWLLLAHSFKCDQLRLKERDSFHIQTNMTARFSKNSDAPLHRLELEKLIRESSPSLPSIFYNRRPFRPGRDFQRRSPSAPRSCSGRERNARELQHRQHGTLACIAGRPGRQALGAEMRPPRRKRIGARRMDSKESPSGRCQSLSCVVVAPGFC